VAVSNLEMFHNNKQPDTLARIVLGSRGKFRRVESPLPGIGRGKKLCRRYAVARKPCSGFCTRKCVAFGQLTRMVVLSERLVYSDTVVTPGRGFSAMTQVFR